MVHSSEVQHLRGVVALLRITVGVILLATWYQNLTKGIYTADGITGLFGYLFDVNGGGPAWYRGLIEATVLAAPGQFAVFLMLAELALGLGLLFGVLTPVVGVAAALFFATLFLAHLGGAEWIWTYVLLTSAALTAGLTRSGRVWGGDQLLLAWRGEAPMNLLW